MIKIVFEEKRNPIDKHFHEVAFFKPVRSFDGKTVKIDRYTKIYNVSDVVWEMIVLKIKEKHDNIHEYGDGRIEVYETLTIIEQKEEKKK